MKYVAYRYLMNVLIVLRPAFAVILLVVSPLASSRAGVTVYPTEVFAKPPNRSAPVAITNSSDSEVEIWISFEYTYPVGFDTGSVVFATPEANDPDEPSSSTWVRAIPERFTLKGRESQVVRLYCSPPPGLRNGEYWARVVVSSKDRKPAVALDDQPKMGMDFITRAIIPFHFRSGPTTTGISIREANAHPMGSAIRLNVILDRTGNASFWGRMTVRLFSSGGKLVRTKEYRIVTYKSFSYRTDFDVSGEPPGQYTLELAFDNKHPGLKSEFRIPSAPVMQRLSVIVP
ncbi:MAG: hypothetical protein ACKVRP_03725 [Bacteroidota bacterium]